MRESVAQPASAGHPAEMGVIGVRPAQLAALADQLRLRPDHHLLAVAGGQSAISVFPQAEDVASLLAPACTSVLGFDTEARFDASILAVCANAWWLDQLAALSDWMVQATGMAPQQVQALLCANLADVASMVRLHPGCSPRELARSVGSPGTYTALGLDHLQQQQAHRVWENSLAQVLDRLRDSAA